MMRSGTVVDFGYVEPQSVGDVAIDLVTDSFGYPPPA
jgi:hypothetical protein